MEQSMALGELIIFTIFAGVAIGMSLVMITSKKAVTSAVALIVVMFCLAGLFAMQSAHLIAALQVLVYAGAIMVLFLFVIMLLNLKEKDGLLVGHQSWLQLGGVIIFSSILAPMIALYDLSAVANKNFETPEDFGTTAGVGKILYTDYILPFEIASVLLLVALVGAVVLTKTRQR